MKFLKIFPIFFLIFSILLFSYTFFRSEIFYSGNNRDYYNIYYIISLICLFFSIITFYLSAKFKIYLLIILFSISFTLYSFEFYLVINEKITSKRLNEEKLKIKNYDHRNFYDAYRDLKKENNSLVISLMNKTLNNKGKKLFSLGGISNSETLMCNENGYYATYESDRYGFNNPDYEWKNFFFEYFVIGDSFVQGHCVNRPNDIGSVLRNITSKNVLSIGNRGTGPLSQYAFLKEYLVPNVKNVVWFFTADNDITDLINELKIEELNLYLKNPNHLQNLKSKQKMIDELLLEIISIEENKLSKITSKRYLFFKSLKIFNVRQMFKSNPKIPDEFSNILKLAQNLVNENGSNLYFVYIPNVTKYFDISYANYYAEIKKIVTDLDIPFVDLDEEVFSKYENPKELFPFSKINHFNVKGYDIVARTVNKIILNLEANN